MIKQDNEREFMQMAIAEMTKSEGGVKVGAVIVIDGKIVATGFRERGTHAERMAIESAKSQGLDLKNAVLYSTLEPCVNLGEDQKKQCCSDLIIENKILKVVIGRYDPNPNVNRRGWKSLRDGNVLLGDFPQDLRDKIDEENKVFVGYFEKGVGPKGGAKVDHRDDGTFEVQFSPDDDRVMAIRWTVAGIDAAYGYGTPPVKVALAKFATDFSDIDDPTAFEFSHSSRIGVGEIGIFRGPDACVLVKPKEIQSGPSYHAEHHFVNFDFVVRILNPR